jgi:large subunit ribosomal protein L25
MKTFQLSGTARTETGKKAGKALRKADLIPAVMYGGAEVIQFTVSTESVRKLIYTPEVYIVELTIGEKTTMAIVKELQFHPVTDMLLHIDFLEVFADKPVVIEIPVALEGHSEGVKAGGRLSLEMRKLKIKALYSTLPEKLVVNIDHLELGKTIQVGSLSFDGLEILNAKNAVVCAVKLTRAARGAAAAAKA